MSVMEGNAPKIIENAATARIYGVDADFDARVTDDFTLSGGVSWDSAHYVNYANASGLVPFASLNPVTQAPVVAACIGLNRGPGGNCPLTIDASHKWLPRAPNITLTLTGDYKKEFSAGTFDANATLYLSGRIYFDSIERVSQAPYGTLAAQASWKPAGTHLTFVAWGKNLTNTKYFSSVYIDSSSDGANYAPPPTFGVAVKYTFDGAPKL